MDRGGNRGGGEGCFRHMNSGGEEEKIGRDGRHVNDRRAGHWKGKRRLTAARLPEEKISLSREKIFSN